MFESKLAAAIKVDGKVLREFKETVYIKYGSEYSIFLKNLSTVRAVVNVFIDGDNIVPGGLVINAGQEINLERSIKSNNLTEGNRLKFIERTAAIENGPRGIKLEDGLVRIEYQFEMPKLHSSLFYPKGVRGFGDDYWESKYGTSAPTKSIGGNSSYNVNGILRSVDWSKNGGAMAQAASASVQNYMSDNNLKNSSNVHDGAATMDWMESEQTRSVPKNDAGITVPGSKSTQSFTTTYVSSLDPAKHSMIFKLLGETPDNEEIRNPVTVKTKQKCITCGKQNKMTNKFCAECGTSLMVY